MTAVVATFPFAIPLGELFTMKHPVIADPQDALKQAQAAAQKQGGTSVVVVHTADNSATDKEKLFYAESLSVAQFLAAQEAPGFVRQVAEGLCRRVSMQDILRAAKNLPADPDRLAEAWRKWLAGRDAGQ